MNYTLYPHQQKTVDFLDKNDKAFIASTMGTGKTLCIIEDIVNKLKQNRNQKFLILAPKSILHAVWEEDFKKFAPGVDVQVCTAPTAKREKAFKQHASVYITNIDALAWLNKQPGSFWKNYTYIAIDESTAIKNNTARTKAALTLRVAFKYRRCMSGTPIAGPITDLFFQYYFLDDGDRLGTSYYKFRDRYMQPHRVGFNMHAVNWVNKETAEEETAELVKDITIRYVLEDVVQMPSRLTYNYKYQLNTKTRKAYEDMRRATQVQLQTGTVDAINATALTTKLLQIASGSVYDTSTGTAHLVDTQRYELVLDLVAQTDHAVVFYNWQSQREEMMKLAAQRKLSATFIDGKVSTNERSKRVTEFQNGDYQVIFLQVKAASHGITLTRAATTIWSCPSYLADYYQQANARVYRIGQTQRTITINIEAENTLEQLVYLKLNDKLSSIELLTEALL